MNNWVPFEGAIIVVYGGRKFRRNAVGDKLLHQAAACVVITLGGEGTGLWSAGGAYGEEGLVNCGLDRSLHGSRPLAGVNRKRIMQHDGRGAGHELPMSRARQFVRC